MAILVALSFPSAAAHPTGTGPSHRSIAAGAFAPVAAAPPAAGGWNLSIGTDRGAICPDGSSNCSTGSGTSKVSLHVHSSGTIPANWSSVQIVFLLELLSYDGVYDYSASDIGLDSCSRSYYLLCEESNGVPFFVHNATQIAAGIQAAHPGTNVSFSLASFGQTISPLDDGDGYRYLVDVANFTANASAFGQAVHDSMLGNASKHQTGILSSNYVLPDSDASDNLLHSSSITALYGALFGSGFAWSSRSHHVVVVIGATAPQDPNYPVDYCVSASGYAYAAKCPLHQPGCEPIFNFTFGASPACEGWIASQNASQPTASIASAAHTAPGCVASLGSNCTVDTIDLWTTPTDASSIGWPPGAKGGGPGSANVTKTVDNILRAGCDLANATGGSWDGPSSYTCPNNVSGTLAMNNWSKGFSNPSLAQALSSIGFGSAPRLRGLPAEPIFRFVPGRNISIVPPVKTTVSCLRAGVAFSGCDTAAKTVTVGGVSELTWNWSSDPALNYLQSGDSWTATFDIAATGGAGVVPIDACSAPTCPSVGAGDGTYSSLECELGNGVPQLVSFPLATITVEPATPISAGLAPLSGNYYAPATVPLAVVAFGGIGPYTATWSFGDGSPIAPGWNVDHFYALPENYSLSVLVTDRTGQTSRFFATVPVLSPANTLLVSVASNLQVDTIGRGLTLYGNASGGYGGNQFVWSGLPAGCTTANTSTLTCVPSGSGLFSIEVMVTDREGGSTTAGLALQVNPLPVVSVLSTLRPSECGSARTVVQFTAVTSGGTAPFTFWWTFGDGAAQSGGTTVTHQFVTGSAWSAAVTATDAVGAVAAGQGTATSPASPACPQSSFSMGDGSAMYIAGALLLGAIGAAGVVVALVARRERR